MLKGGALVAIGSRIQPDGSDMRESQPAQRRLVGRLFTSMRKALRVLPDIDDTQCPMKGFRHDVAQQVFERQQLHGWIFDAEVLHIARTLGYEIHRGAGRLAPCRGLAVARTPDAGVRGRARPDPPALPAQAGEGASARASARSAAGSG